MASETRYMYIHGMVNHFQNFVAMDPVTGVHMNSIEGTWTRTKAQVRICLGRTWWSTCGEIQETLFAHITAIYPV